MIYLSFLLLLLLNSCGVLASDGDRSPYYIKCVKSCKEANCTKDGRDFTVESAPQQEWTSQVMWNCRDECQYRCMWKTVNAFRERGYVYTPKFHGKWPFIRILGIQEPASVFASLLNMWAHVYMHSKLRKRFPVRRAPVVLLWHAFFAVCVHAWCWSVIFHSRDTPFTEFMDYACALSMVTALFVAGFVRVFHRRRVACSLTVLATLLYYLQHVRYLYTGRIDYDYNMIVNVVIGALGCLLFTWIAISRLKQGVRGARPLLLFTILSAGFLALEILDFPPILGICDAHALWHFATASTPILFYSYVIADLEDSKQDPYLPNKHTNKIS